MNHKEIESKSVILEYIVLSLGTILYINLLKGRKIKLGKHGNTNTNTNTSITSIRGFLYIYSIPHPY
jgi:hypothetical protein